MSIEIEAKIKVESFEAVAQKLKELGAEFLAEKLQRDCYFDDAELTLIKNGKGLRLRVEETGQDRKVFLTFKGPKKEDVFKKRQEIELQVDSVSCAEEFLDAIGYRRILTFEKKRSMWKISSCEVCLDELPLLGKFVEIEAPDSKIIEAVLPDLNLKGYPHIEESYAFLIKKKLQELGKSEVEVLF